jgi:hypothetical protein
MKTTCYIIFLAVMAMSCANESDPVSDQARFTKIYDNNRFNASYEPLDVIHTTDGGYLVLGTRRLQDSNFRGIYLMRTDKFGAFVAESEPDVDLVSPIGPILNVGGKHYFFAMTTIGLQSQLVELGEDATIGAAVNAGGSYPSAAAVDGENLLLLNYDIDNKESVLSLMKTDGSTIKRRAFSVGAGDAVDEPIINHFLRTGRALPFQVGTLSAGKYFFNGFYNYTLSVVITDLNSDTPQGVIQGQQDDGGINRLEVSANGKYAISRFNFDDHYFLPSTPLPVNGISSSMDLGGYSLPELADETPVAIFSATINARPILIYGGNTKGKQIGLYGYDPTTGSFLGTRYVGFSNTFEIADLAATADGGIIVCGTTYLAGRFPRFCLFKLPATELAASFK